MRLFFIALLIPSFSYADLYIDHVTEKGKQYIIIEKNNNKVKIEVSPKDDEATQIAKVCKVMRCNEEK